MAIVMTLTYITHPNGDSHLAAIRACEAGGKICWLSGRNCGLAVFIIKRID
jgi:hypothetical protein